MHEDLDITNHGPQARPLQPRDRHPLRLRRRVRGEVEPHRPPRPHHHRLVGRASEAAHHLSQRGFPARGAYRHAPRGPARRLTPTARLSFEVGLDPGQTWHCCLLYDLIDGNRHFHGPHDCARSAHAAQHANGHDRLAADGVEDPHQQRGILSLLSPGDRGHGGAAPADRGHRPHGVRARRRPALVHGAVRPRQPDRVAAEHPDLSGVRPRRAGCAGPLAGEGARRLSRRRAGQDHARAALRRAGAFQADPAHAVLRHRGRHAAVSDHAARRVARDRRSRRCWSGTSTPPRAAWPGSTTAAIATATGSRSTRPARRSATRTWPGRMPAIP